jgi:hypothetical protein
MGYLRKSTPEFSDKIQCTGTPDSRRLDGEWGEVDAGNDVSVFLTFLLFRYRRC